MPGRMMLLVRSAGILHLRQRRSDQQEKGDRGEKDQRFMERSFLR